MVFVLNSCKVKVIVIRIIEKVPAVNIYIPKRGAKYCDQRVCLSARMSQKPRPNFTKFYVHVACGRGLILLCQQCYTLCTSGFVYDVIFSNNEPNIDTGLESAV